MIMYCAEGSCCPFSLKYLCNLTCFIQPTRSYTYLACHPLRSFVLFLAGNIALSRVMNICVQSGVFCIKVCFVCIITGLLPPIAGSEGHPWCLMISLKEIKMSDLQTHTHNCTDLLYIKICSVSFYIPKGKTTCLSL